MISPLGAVDGTEEEIGGIIMSSGNIVSGAVRCYGVAHESSEGFRTIQASVKSGSTTGTSGTDVALGTNYQYQMLRSLTDPNTGAAWTLPAVNAAEFGIKITN